MINPRCRRLTGDPQVQFIARYINDLIQKEAKRMALTVLLDFSVEATKQISSAKNLKEAVGKKDTAEK